jgi:hypothetical protein
MSTGDVVQTATGVVAVIVSLLVARMVFMFERRDRKTEQAQQTRQAQEVERRHRIERAEREQRSARRARHSEDYRRAGAALDQIQRVFEEFQRGPLNKIELDDFGIDTALKEVGQITQRVPELDEPLSAVWSAASSLRAEYFPSVAQFQYALAASPQEQAERLLAQVHHAVRSGVKQAEAARDGKRAVIAARAALAREWEEPHPEN